MKSYVKAEGDKPFIFSVRIRSFAKERLYRVLPLHRIYALMS